jgi:hypothetical protein
MVELSGGKPGRQAAENPISGGLALARRDSWLTVMPAGCSLGLIQNPLAGLLHRPHVGIRAIGRQ